MIDLLLESKLEGRKTRGSKVRFSEFGRLSTKIFARIKGGRAEARRTESPFV